MQTICYNFFSKVVSYIKIPDYYNDFPQKTYILSQLSLKCLKIPQYSQFYKKEIRFSIFIQKEYSRSGIESYPGLNTKENCLTSNTPTKFIKLNCNIFSKLIYKHFNYCIDKGEFPNDLKHPDIVTIYKKITNAKKKTIDL